MSEEIQDAPKTQDLSTGTSEDGQSNQSAVVNQPNDPQFMQADYTRKTMELAEQRKAFEAEKQAWEQNRYQQPVQPQQQAHDYSQKSYQDLVDQFGVDGAKAILSRDQLTQQQLNQFRFESLYSQEELRGRYKYGEESWNKHNYFDQRTGQVKNKVMDYRVMVNPLTGAAMTLDEAWRAANPVDPDKIAKEAKEQAYKEIQNKSHSTPTKPGGAPITQPSKHATSISEAYQMARREVG